MIKTSNTQKVRELVAKIKLPDIGSHKGQNGKLLVVGGSELFHSSLIWSAEMASKMVDMVHVTSPAETNNQLMRLKLKEIFMNGIVVPWKKVDEYIDEDDCVLIGPGMTREEGREVSEEATSTIVNRLVSQNTFKKWVIDGGALQEIDPSLLNGNTIITPHQGEWERLLSKSQLQISNDKIQKEYSKLHGGLTILLKGPIDTVVRGEEVVQVEGGNSGMTKGGTGDVLAGLVAALATGNDLFLSAQVASVINKRAGDELYKSRGQFFNASDLLDQIPRTLNELLG